MNLQPSTKDKIYASVIWSAFIGQALSYSKVYLFHIVVLVATLFLIFNDRERPLKLRTKLKSFWFFGYLVIWSLFSFLTVNDKLGGLVGCLQLYSGLCIVIFWNLVEDKKLILKGLFYLFMAHFILGLLEAFTPIRWPLSAISPYAVYFGKAPTSLPVSYRAYPSGFFWHPNNASFIILMASPYILNNHRLNKFFKTFFILLAIVFIIKSGAKAQLILFSAYCFYLLVKHSKDLLKQTKYFLALLTIIVVGSGVLYKTLNQDQRDELFTTVDVVYDYGFNTLNILRTGKFTNITGAVEERLRFIVGAQNEVRKSPLTGVGIGQHNKLEVIVNNVPTPMKSIHHYWLELAMIGGMLLFIPFIIFIFGLIIRNFRAHKLENVESMTLFCVGVISLSSGIYFLPQWILYSMANDKISMDEEFSQENL